MIHEIKERNFNKKDKNGLNSVQILIHWLAFLK